MEAHAATRKTADGIGLRRLLPASTNTRACDCGRRKGRWGSCLPDTFPNSEWLASHRAQRHSQQCPSTSCVHAQATGRQRLPAHTVPYRYARLVIWGW